MKHGMKLAMAVLLSGWLGLAAAPRAEAVEPGPPHPTADISITVTIQRLSVLVAGTPVAFGIITPGSEPVSTPKVVVTNDGNVTETYGLKLAYAGPLMIGTVETPPWTPAQSTDKFVLQALFTGDDDPTSPAAGDFGADPVPANDDVVTTVDHLASVTDFGFAPPGSTATGAGVPVAGLRDLYFKYSAPSPDTVTGGAAQSITVTISANPAGGP